MADHQGVGDQGGVTCGVRLGSRAPNQFEGDHVRSTTDRVSIRCARRIGVVGQNLSSHALSDERELGVTFNHELPAGRAGVLRN